MKTEYVLLLYGLVAGFALAILFTGIAGQVVKMRRAIAQDAIYQLTGRKLSLVWNPDTSKWSVIEHRKEAEYINATSSSWLRAINVALHGLGPVPGCDSCRIYRDAVDGRPYAICANCGRTLLDEAEEQRTAIEQHRANAAAAQADFKH